jgi:SOS-response transcriptional repressor LexA
MANTREIEPSGDDNGLSRGDTSERPGSAALSRLEERALRFITRYLAENTFQPSYREIASHLRLKSTKQVSDLLLGLEMKGFVERVGQQSRSVRLLRVRLLPEIVELHAHPASAVSGFAPSLLLDPRLIPNPGTSYFIVGRAADETLTRGDMVFVRDEPERCLNSQVLITTEDGASAIRTIFSLAEIGEREVVHGRVVALLRLLDATTKAA